MKICCFTGHRSISAENIIKLPALLDTTISHLIEKGVTTFRTGGAVGFDTLCALKVLEKKKSNPDILLELCLPCKNQTDGWSEMDKSIYNYIISNADRVRYAHEKYVSGCMHDRNRMLVRDSDWCVAYCSSSKGGTAYTVKYALSYGLELINLYELIK